MMKTKDYDRVTKQLARLERHHLTDEIRKVLLRDMEDTSDARILPTDVKDPELRRSLEMRKAVLDRLRRELFH